MGRDHGRARGEEKDACKHFEVCETCYVGKLTKLLLAVEPEVTDHDYDLAAKSDPERRGRERAAF